MSTVIHINDIYDIYDINKLLVEASVDQCDEYAEQGDVEFFLQQSEPYIPELQRLRGAYEAAVGRPLSTDELASIIHGH
jgi:hypothetical protein